ncbi:hypothetical protein OG322_26650 [Streptomyces sp. NBC_01260]|uniref:hypothetical protein n=1 Tax=Streptomyces sp. NBC_01260 TaxID=2903801 RepID=UPI002E3640ED|nr:hypothetical protein [Streptomyces sp. NBC_01260]
MPPLHHLERIVTAAVRPAQDHAYRAWLGHTLACAACRAGAACTTVVRLGHAWRQARQ